MLYAAHARFRPASEAERDRLHEAFSDHMGQPGLRIRLAVSLRDEAGARTGVLFVIEADSPEPLRRLLDLSPYLRAGLYDQLVIEIFDIEAGSLG